jgi:integrase
MRVGEAWHLTWDRVHPDLGIIEVPDEGKTGYRSIPINSICRAALVTLHEQSEGSRFVIPNPPGKMDSERTFDQMRYWARSVEKLATRAGIDEVTAHTLRHTFASRLVMAGVNLSRVQEFLGHSSIVETMRYAHLAPERGQADIERLVAPAAVVETAPAAAKPVRAAKVRRIA